MERDDFASLAGVFYGSAPLERGSVARLDEDGAHHLRVRRLDVGERIYLADGAGTQAVGEILRIGKRDAEVSIHEVVRLPRPAAIHVLVPIADRDRMMWCAEKCAELGAASWRPVLWTRSRSVSPRGEGEPFATKVRARMASALIQSHAPWLPDVHADGQLSTAIAALPSGGVRLSLDLGGDPIGQVNVTAPVTLAVGPEGGIEESERRILRDAGFRAVSLGANVLRFETAAIAALAIVRSRLEASSETTNG